MLKSLLNMNKQCDCLWSSEQVVFLESLDFAIVSTKSLEDVVGVSDVLGSLVKV